MKKDIKQIGLEVALKMATKKDNQIVELKKNKLIADFTIKMMTEVIEEKEKDIAYKNLIIEDKDKEIKRLELLLKKNYITQ